MERSKIKPLRGEWVMEWPCEEGELVWCFATARMIKVTGENTDAEIEGVRYNKTQHELYCTDPSVNYVLARCPSPNGPEWFFLEKLLCEGCRETLATTVITEWSIPTGER